MHPALPMTSNASPNHSQANSPFNRTAQHDAKRVAILSQAAKLFNAKGSRATTLKDIAQSLGLTKTSLYYYVRTKEDLIYQCYTAALDHHHLKLDNIEVENDTPLSRIRAFLLQHFEDHLAAREERSPHIAALMEIAALKGEQREEVESRYIEMFKRIRQYLRDGLEDGSLRECEPTATARALLGSVDWIFFWASSLEADKVREAGNDAIDIMTHGISRSSDAFVPTTGHSKADNSVDLQGFNRSERNRLKQEAFYKTGTWFFNKQGFNGTSLDEIAEELNVSKGAFYYHIKNKEDLLLSCYERSIGITQDIYSRASAYEGNGIEKAALCCRDTFYCQNSDEGPLIRYTSITALPTAHRLDVIKRTEESNQRFGDFLRDGIEDGSVRNINTVVAQQLIAGAINAAMDLKLWRRVDDIDAAAIDYFDVFFNGLVPRKA